MNKREAVFSWLTYLTGMTLVITEVLSGHISYVTINFAVLLIMVAWILCLKDAVRKDPPKWLWVWLIAFFGGATIPVYLLTDAGFGSQKARTNA